jgi:hypothetical protein
MLRVTRRIIKQAEDGIDRREIEMFRHVIGRMTANFDRFER